MGYGGGGGGLVGDLLGAGLGIATGGFGFAAEAGLGTLGTAALGGAIGGAAGGGLQSALTGGSILGGLEQGALVGGIGGAGASELAGSSLLGSTASGLDGGVSALGTTDAVAGSEQLTGDALYRQMAQQGLQSGVYGSTGVPIQDAVASVSAAGMNPGATNPSLMSALGQLASTGGGAIGGGGIGLNAGTAASLYSLYQGNQISKMQDPNLKNYQGQLANLVNNPASLVNTPGYQFQFGQGMQALGRQQAAQGYGGSGANPGTGGGSGNFATAAQQYGQNFAQSNYQQQLQNLAGLSQPNLTAVNGGNMMNLLGIGMLGQQAIRGG